jgi:chromosome segregation ATPase
MAAYMVEAPPPESTFSFFRRSSRKHHHHRNSDAHTHHTHHRRSSLVHHQHAAAADPSSDFRITAAEWDAVQKRERAFREANEAFARENDALKTGLRDAKADVTRLTAAASTTRTQLGQLAKDNNKLRTEYADAVALANKHYADAKQQRAKVDKMRLEKDVIEAELRRLRRDLDRAARSNGSGSNNADSDGTTRPSQASASSSHRHGWRQRFDELRHAVDGWKRRAEDSDKKCAEYQRKIARLETLLKDQEDTLETYEKILRRHGHVYG